ncbi:MAG: GH116 family glycosyl hydrolase, partial [Chitinophagaceae bacterium]
MILPGKEKTFHFLISWYFPNTKLPVRDAQSGNYYAKRFTDAGDVAQYVAANFERLSSLTHLWRDTWYDSALPYWFLDRSFANTSSLATGTAHRFATGRFWGWEGVGCCEGTCTHVWQYAQAMARIFPSLERGTRERVDLGLAFDEKTGMIGYRGEGTGEATDGQAGTVLRIYREHQMSADNSFLQRNWPHIKKAIQFLLNHDYNQDGIIDGAQPNTLDAAWYGEIAWISSLCLAAWKAGEEMAMEMGDNDFAQLCKNRFIIGRKNVDDLLFNGEYFIQLPDSTLPKRPLGSYKTCEIDQVFGQSWAWQVGLGRILDKEKTLSALRSLWKYNYTPDVGPYIRAHTGGRPYALAGEGGMLMDTNPFHVKDPYGDDITWQVGYFNECMTGFEHQVASHM